MRIAREDPANQDRLENLAAALRTAASETLGLQKPKQYIFSQEIHELSLKQKELRLRASNEHDITRRGELRKQRGLVLKKIHSLTHQNALAMIDAKAAEVEALKDNAQKFAAAKHLRSTEPNKVCVTDVEGRIIWQSKEQAQVVANFFHSQLHDEAVPPLAPFIGPPRPLTNPISESEVEAAIKTLKNRKAAGSDGVPAELLKKGGPVIASEIKEILNDIFTHHVRCDLGTSIIVPLQKPAKPKGPCSSLRPVALLRVFRKVLSTIYLSI